MRNFFAGCVVCFALVATGQMAEHLKTPIGPEDLEYFKLNRDGGVLEWKHPVYPKEPKADWSEERVRVGFVVDVNGRVTDPEVLSGPERFHAPALAAITQWKFAPSLVNGVVSPVAYEVYFVFKPDGPNIPVDPLTGAPYRYQRAPTTELGSPPNSEPVYPPFLATRRLSGEVELMLGVNPAGRVDGVEIIRAAHPDFLSAALQSVASWEFPPARQGRLPVAAQTRSVLYYFAVDDDGRETHADWLERTGIFLLEPANTKTAEYFDRTPQAVRMVDPVYPYEPSVAGITGGARVDFTVNVHGRVELVAVSDATAPEFGEAVAAAIAAWQFVPLQHNGETCRARFSFTWRFEAPRPESTEQRLLDAAKAGTAPATPPQLDRRLLPLFRRAPVYPSGLRGAGRAEVEIVIDRDGRVRLPRVRSASQPGFGAAAATALSQWWFETPLKGGEAVDVRAVVPFEFKEPSLAPEDEKAARDN